MRESEGAVECAVEGAVEGAQDRSDWPPTVAVACREDGFPAVLGACWAMAGKGWAGPDGGTEGAGAVDTARPIAKAMPMAAKKPSTVR
jgi:hypothetical protein